MYFIEMFSYFMINFNVGFHLVDEPEPVSVSAVTNRVFDTRGDNRGHEEHDELNDTLTSNDDVLLPSNSGGKMRGSLDNDLKDQRQIFEKRREELMILGKKEAALRAQRTLDEKKSKGVEMKMSEKGSTSTGGGGGRGGNKSVVVGVNALDEGPGPGPGPSVGNPGLSRGINGEPDEDPYNSHHKTAIHKNSKISKNLDLNILETTATKLQSQFRGYSTRKNLSPQSQIGFENENLTSKSQLVARGKDSGKSSDILTAEQTIRTSLRAIEGVQPYPNISEGFQTVDTKRRGFVNRKQFAHVMQQLTAIKLYGTELRACMDFFDRSGEGTQIDYNAFSRMCRYKQPEGLPELQRLKKMVLGPNSLKTMAVYDPLGTGFIKRGDMLRALSELGNICI
jgi:Ca2+-binding EF-hand superfamily protein